LFLNMSSVAVAFYLRENKVSGNWCYICRRTPSQISIARNITSSYKLCT